MSDLAILCLTVAAACLLWACCTNHRSPHSMTPKTYTIISAHGQHAAVVLYPQPFGKGVDREGNIYRIVGDAAHLIEE